VELRPSKGYLPGVLEPHQSNIHSFGSSDQRQTNHLELLGGSPPPPAASFQYQRQSDSEEDAQLVVDESVGRHRTTIKPASLKQNLPGMLLYY